MENRFGPGRGGFFALSGEKGESCTRPERDFALSEEKGGICTKSEQDFALNEEKGGICTKIERDFTLSGETGEWKREHQVLIDKTGNCRF